MKCPLPTNPWIRDVRDEAIHQRRVRERVGSGEGAVWDEISISPSSGGVGNRFHSWTQYCVFHSSTVFEATSVQSGTSVALLQVARIGLKHGSFDTTTGERETTRGGRGAEGVRHQRNGSGRRSGSRGQTQTQTRTQTRTQSGSVPENHPGTVCRRRRDCGGNGGGEATSRRFARGWLWRSSA